MIKSSIARVKGMVQGVGFRYSALNKARSLGLRGWVRNEPDGSVSTRFEGPEKDVNAFISWLNTGPSSAVVSELIVNDLNPEDSLKTFHVTF